MAASKEEQQEQLNSTFNSAQLLSIPSQQGEPPKHSTPKRSDWEDGRPMLDQSSICDDFDRRSNISAVLPLRNEPPPPVSASMAEREMLASYFDNELHKKRFTTTSSSRSPSKTLNFLQDGPPDVLLNQGAIDLSHQLPRNSAARAIVGSSDASTSAGPDSQRRTYHRKIPKLERPQQMAQQQLSSRPISSASETDTIASTIRKNLLGIERNRTHINFGFVPVGERLLLRQRIWNCDSEKMRIKCSILSATSDEPPEQCCFKIVDVSTPIMRPGEWCEITVLYEPMRVEKNVARLAVERENGSRFRYSFTLLGTGGIAQLHFLTNFDDGIAQRATSGRAILLRPDIFNRFWLTFENGGQRSAFVFLIATDRKGNILTREIGHEQQQVSIQPAQFVLDAPDGEKGTHRKAVLVRVDEAFNWREEEEEVDFDGDAKQPKLGKVLASINGRCSILSSASSMLSPANQSSECAFQIMAYWGEECQRQRLKCWERANKPFNIGGFRFTGQFDGEAPLSVERRRRLQETVKDGDATEFKESLRIMEFNVIDERARTNFPTQSDAIQPLIHMYRNKRVLMREA